MFPELNELVSVFDIQIFSVSTGYEMKTENQEEMDTYKIVQLP